MTMTVQRRCARHRLVKAVAGLALAGSAVGLITTGVAEAQVAPPLNVTATNVAGPPQAINIDWDTGSQPPTPPAVLTPTTYWVIRITPDGGPTTQLFTAANVTEVNGVAVLPSTHYTIEVEANDATTVASGFTSITTAPGPTVECATAVWTPFCTPEAFIRQQYHDWEDRVPRLDELNYWLNFLQTNPVTGAATGRDTTPAVYNPPWPNAGAMLQSGTQNVFLDTFRQNIDLKAGPVIRLYIAYFLRNPDYAGYKFWLNAVTNGGWTLNQVSDFFASSAEFNARYGALNNAEFVSLVYNNVLFRNPDGNGFSYWTNQLNAGMSRGTMMLQFAEAPSLEFQTRNRVAVAMTEVFGEMLNRAPTLAEYDAGTRNPALSGPYPLQPSAVNPLYIQILASAQYRSATRQGGPIVIH